MVAPTKLTKPKALPQKETKNAKKRRLRKEASQLLQSSAGKESLICESLSEGESNKQSSESDCSVSSSKHELFIKSISESFNSYSLESANNQASDSASEVKI